VNTAGSSQPKDDFYDAAPVEPLLLYQGEILVDVPLLLVRKESRWLLLRTRSGRTIHEALKNGELSGPVQVLDSNQSAEKWRTAIDGDSAVAYLTKRPVLVLSQTCDIQNKDFIQVAPIFNAAPEDIERLKAGNDLYSVFYLQAHPPHFPDSYADLELMQAVHKTYLKNITSDRHFRLKDEQVRLLQRRITRYFGRPNSYDARADAVPMTDTYLCVDCFYFDGVATAINCKESERFPECSTCGGVSWVRKGP
jgi:hypothetical protein